MAAGFDIAGASLEKFYHHLFKTDRTIIALIDELGLGDKLVWRQPVTSVFLGGEEHRLNSAGSLLRFGPLSIFDRIRMGAVLAYLKALWRPRGAGRDHGVGVAALSHGEAGLRNRLAAAAGGEIRIDGGRHRGNLVLVENSRSNDVVGLSARRVSAALRSAGRGGDRPRREHTASASTLPASPARDDSLLVETDAGAEKFDRVISTLPTRTTCKLARDLPDSYRAQYDWGEAYGAHCVILSMDRQFMNAYWLSILDEGFPFMAAVEHTNYMPAGRLWRATASLSWYLPPHERSEFSPVRKNRSSLNMFHF